MSAAVKPAQSLAQQYREAIKRLTQHSTGICVDATCPKCGYPEMSFQVKWPEPEPLGVTICRQCGHAVLS